jgi:hypothetical protein
MSCFRCRSAGRPSAARRVCAGVEVLPGERRSRSGRRCRCGRPYAYPSRSPASVTPRAVGREAELASRGVAGRCSGPGRQAAARRRQPVDAADAAGQQQLAWPWAQRAARFVGVGRGRKQGRRGRVMRQAGRGMRVCSVRAGGAFVRAATADGAPIGCRPRLSAIRVAAGRGGISHACRVGGLGTAAAVYSAGPASGGGRELGAGLGRATPGARARFGGAARAAHSHSPGVISLPPRTPSRRRRRGQVDPLQALAGGAADRRRSR